MGDVASLLTSIAAVISAIGGIVIGVVALTRGSPRERERAARYAIDRVMGADDEDEDDDRLEAIAEIVDEVWRKRSGGDEP